jgi:integrase
VVLDVPIVHVSNGPTWILTMQELNYRGEKLEFTGTYLYGRRPLRKGSFVFYTNRCNPYIQTLVKIDMNGAEKYTTLNLITTKFSRLIKKTGINVPKGTGFYSLRRTAATIAARSGDPFAVQRLLGHADLTMATRYVQDVSK